MAGWHFLHGCCYRWGHFRSSKKYGGIVSRSVSSAVCSDILHSSIRSVIYHITKTQKTQENRRFFRQYNALGFPSRVTLGCSMLNPSRSQRVCCGVSRRTSLSFRSHWNPPLSRRFCKSRNPSPSHSSPLIRPLRLPQTRNSTALYDGSSFNCPYTMAARPSVDRSQYGCPGSAVEGELVRLMAQNPHIAPVVCFSPACCIDLFNFSMVSYEVALSL